VSFLEEMGCTNPVQRSTLNLAGAPLLNACREASKKTQCQQFQKSAVRSGNQTWEKTVRDTARAVFLSHRSQSPKTHKYD